MMHFVYKQKDYQFQIINYKQLTRPNMNSPFISIEGNIGSGKSTILKIIKDSFPELTILDEPLTSWEKVGENGNVNLLKLYYSDPKRWGFTFQIYAFMTRLKKWNQFSRLNCPNIKISQRSLLSDRYIFANIMRDMDILSQTQHQAYLNCYRDLIKMRKISKVKGVIYVQCDPKTCSQRIKKRARQGQGEIPLDYLQKLHEKHEEWLNPSQKHLQQTQSSSNSQTSQQNTSEQMEQLEKQHSESQSPKTENNEVNQLIRQQENKTQNQSISSTSRSTSITSQKVLIIDNRVPIDRNRIINQIRDWIHQFNANETDL